MRITITVITGGIGRHLPEQCPEGGHKATAVVRAPVHPVSSVQMDLTAIAYRTTLGHNPHHYRPIGRAAVADFMLRALGDASSIRQAIGIAR